MKKEKITVPSQKTKIVEQRFTGWTGGFGIHKDKKTYDRNNEKRKLQKGYYE